MVVAASATEAVEEVVEVEVAGATMIVDLLVVVTMAVDVVEVIEAASAVGDEVVVPNPSICKFWP